jgi:hypothetical protein
MAGWGGTGRQIATFDKPHETLRLTDLRSACRMCGTHEHGCPLTSIAEWLTVSVPNELPLMPLAPRDVEAGDLLVAARVPQQRAVIGAGPVDEAPQQADLV